MIKTSINRHDIEYFLYAMVRAFFPGADVIAPDTAAHNIPGDGEEESADRLDCIIDENARTFSMKITKGIFLENDRIWNWKLTLPEQEIKDEVRGYIYDGLCEYSGKELPWGNLTGIRPTKIYLLRMIEGQLSKRYGRPFVTNGYVNENVWPFDEEVIQDVIRHMNSYHRVSMDKCKLASDIAIREQSLMVDVVKPGSYSLYIGVPFCPSTCLYCSFTSYPIISHQDKVEEYLRCIKKELEATLEVMNGRVPDTVYIGGGTPTSLSANQLDTLLGYLTDTIDISGVKEFTVEAGRPDSITREKFEVLKKYNVSRISINPQTMKDETLKTIGRHHNVAQFVEAFKMAREMGFDNINTDIILGLTGETVEDVQDTIDRLTELAPDSLTVHSLAIKRASRLKGAIDKGSIQMNTGFDFERAMGIASEGAARIGLKPYYLYRQKDMGGNLENTGFAREGCYGLYNVLMMEEVQSIIACGAGTVTKRVFADGHIERCDTAKDVDIYISKIEEMIERKRQLFMTTEC